jgi:hypothetical protein
MGQLKEGTSDYDRGTPTVSIVKECLTRHTIHPLLQAVYDIEFAIIAHIFISYSYSSMVSVFRLP